MSPADIHKTAFICYKGRFEFNQDAILGEECPGSLPGVNTGSEGRSLVLQALYG